MTQTVRRVGVVDVVGARRRCVGVDGARRRCVDVDGARRWRVGGDGGVGGGASVAARRALFACVRFRRLRTSFSARNACATDMKCVDGTTVTFAVVPALAGVPRSPARRLPATGTSEMSPDETPVAAVAPIQD